MTLVDPWGPAEKLLLAAGGRGEGLLAAVAAVGLKETAEVIRDEILLRCEPLAYGSPVRAQLELVHGDERLGYVVTFADGRVSAESGWLDTEPRPTVRLTVEETLRSLFAPGPAVTPNRNVRMGMPAQDAWSGGFDWALTQIRATAAIVAAVTERPADLGRLSMEYGSDKWGGWHFYTPHYERHLARLRDEPVRVLEIGIGGYTDPDLGGGSLRMWRRYFRRGLVLGMDIHAKPGVQGPRIRTVRGDQTDIALMARLGAEAGPFDLVVDDGSHNSPDVAVTFEALLPYVRPGGFYVIEDLQTSYWPEFGGSTPGSDSGTTVGYLKTLVDGLHHPEYDHPEGFRPSYPDLNVAGIHLHRNIAFIEKGSNTVEGLPVMRTQPVPPTEEQ